MTTTTQTPPPPPPAQTPVIDAFHIKVLTPYVGARLGLPDKTGVLALEYSMAPHRRPAWDAVDAYLDQAMARLLPGDALVPGWRQAVLQLRNASEGSADPIAQSLAERCAHLAVTLMQWVREPVERAVVWQATPGRWMVGVAYEHEEVARIAMQHALRLLLMAFEGGSVASDARLNEMEEWLIREQASAMSPANFRFMRAARQRQMPVAMRQGFIQLGWGAAARRLDGTFTSHSANIAVRIARLKTQTNRLLAESGLPVPRSVQVRELDQALSKVSEWGWPVVIKPSNQDQGTAVVPDIRDDAHLKQAFEAAAKHSPHAVIVEQHVPGDDHRMLVVGGALKVVTRRHPGGVWGDGVSTVHELLQRLNADPMRGSGKRSMLIRIELDEEALRCLADQGFTPESTPPAGRFVRLRRTANISTGGTAEDVTARVHPDNQALAIRAARVLGLDIAGVDFLCPDITRSWREVGGAICEVNAQPGLRVHWLGDPGRDINGEIVDWLMQDTDGRIPTAAITGTNGKSTVARMLHHIWQSAGKVTGVCTTNGVWVGHEQVSDKNLSGFPGARMLFNDPAVEAAVIELPRKGLLQFGHPCDRYDVAALLNVQDDHIGVDGIKSLQDMARLKAEVLERAAQAIVINAEDALCLAARVRAGTKRHILVGRSAAVPAIEAHRAEGGQAVFVQTHEGKPWIVMATGAAQTPLMPLHDIPATMDGLLKFNESNALFAVALAWAQGLPLDTIRQAMTSFYNSPEHNPGRYNLIDGLPFQVLLDYGHNPDGVAELCAIARQLPVSGRRILMNQKLGNRHRAHFVQMAQQLGQTFDRFVLGCDPEYVRHCPDYSGEDPVANMLKAGQQSLLDAGVAADRMADVADQGEAIRQALAMAQPGDLLVLLAEPWVALPLIEQWCNAAGLTAKLP